MIITSVCLNRFNNEYLNNDKDADFNIYDYGSYNNSSICNLSCSEIISLLINNQLKFEKIYKR